MCVLISVMETHRIERSILPKPIYDQYYVVERTNAWMNSFRSLRSRFDTTVES